MILKHHVYTIVIFLALCAAGDLQARIVFPLVPRTAPVATVTTSTLFRAAASSGERDPRQVIKMNLSQLLLRNLSFQYEFAFHKNFSIGVGMNFVLNRTLPGFFSSDDSTAIRLPDPQLKGWAITPEFRFYPGRKEKHQAPHGFYMAAYLRYASYALNSSYHMRFVDGQEYGYDFNANYSGTTAGFMLGYQWLIGRHFSIDFWMAGIGAGRSKLSADITSRGFEMDDSQQQQLKSTLEHEFDNQRLVNYRPEITTTPTSARAHADKVPMLSLRGLGLTIGFAF